MTGHRRSHDGDDLERYLDWRVEKWELDRARLLKGAAGAAAAGMAASLLGAGSAFARRFG
jgi:hypothetical protein